MASWNDEAAHEMALKTLICGGIAGIVTWASVFPLDVIKTRLQTQKSFMLATVESGSPPGKLHERHRVLDSWEISKEAYRTSGLRVFYRGLGVCSLRAFGVNAVQVSFLHRTTLILRADHASFAVGNIRMDDEGVQ
ncbi:hypothetical protein H112_08515 [Trichophyton rubrum D6]|uniref:Mitochondrial thiamine pyrophosphate carrier 1 n=3 Tax=Trichophyton TaxID=5550 RepID=A0A080WGX7_TRIRC|nr:uncharacterized protein TERG_11678 [Trichophyton rubrum CBS 118892]EZF10187.1 hypothetical protein H100_08538 [Trichophyton rubrum MR850]EZF37009.1 hypothetical protein H102_08497 [Trichophyton rubrum CBS 100081]EZF47784.1 hypothetical protein H103_08519 [Trichophyton rubrum CBS 288.86]EZF58301.1 hypothetical protein H104_08471 [Trichophyton rubrum CBS 289.86]EZF68980.1 hypothetical protein H105_08525 [Trichophyton soudanense CBS 452.61]EZF79587.1 hypothetical protein H110_08521 [Trichophy